MGKSVDNSVLDAALNEVATSDEMNVCSAEPLTYYEGCDPADWVASTSYSLGDAVKPTTRNGYVYECTGAGTSGGTEPAAWGTTPGGTTADNTVTWTCRNNYVLATQAMVSGDFTVGEGDTNGRKVAVAQKADVAIHTTDTATHVAQVDDIDKALLLVTTCTSQPLTSGNTVTVPTYDYELADPT